MLISDEPVISFSYSSVPSMSVKTFAARSRSVVVASGFLAVLTASSISSKLLPDALGASDVSSSGSSSPNSSSEGVRLVKVSSSLSSGTWAGRDTVSVFPSSKVASSSVSSMPFSEEDIFPILTSYPELENYLSPFMDAWLGGAAEQLMGQIASAKIPLSRMISPQLYWVMSDSEFTLDINNPEEPKILCVGNNPDRQNIYGAALGLYNSRIVKLINKKGMLKSSVIIDELPTIYFKGLDNLIATARSNKVAVCLGFQDFSQLVRDYGDKEAKVVMNTVGNIFSGQVVGETAKTLSERFGKVLQKRQSISINRQDVSTSINTQMDALIPPSKISGLTQGMFVGSVSDNFNERIEQKIFHCEIVVDAEKVKREESAYKKIPVITNFTDEDGNDRMKETVQANYRRIKEEVKQIVQEELERIKNDPVLCKLLPDNETV